MFFRLKFVTIRITIEFVELKDIDTQFPFYFYPFSECLIQWTLMQNSQQVFLKEKQYW